MGVADLQRVEGPFHQIEAPGYGVVALGELETAADAGVAVLGQNGQHVRVEVRLAVAIARQRHGETNQVITGKRSYDLAADALRHHKDTAGDGSAVPLSPHFDLRGAPHPKAVGRG